MNTKLMCMNAALLGAAIAGATPARASNSYAAVTKARRVYDAARAMTTDARRHDAGRRVQDVQDMLRDLATLRTAPLPAAGVSAEKAESIYFGSNRGALSVKRERDAALAVATTLAGQLSWLIDNRKTDSHSHAVMTDIELRNWRDKVAVVRRTASQLLRETRRLRAAVLSRVNDASRRVKNKLDENRVQKRSLWAKLEAEKRRLVALDTTDNTLRDILYRPTPTFRNRAERERYLVVLASYAPVMKHHDMLRGQIEEWQTQLDRLQGLRDSWKGA